MHAAVPTGPVLGRRQLVQGGLAAAALALAAGSAARLAAAVPAADALGRVRVAALANPNALAAQMDAILTRLVRMQAFSGAALVAVGGRPLLAKGYAWADAGQRVPNAATTRLRIASLTKQFTAMAILQLADRGRLRVQDRLGAHLADIPPAWGAITLQQLLTHTSGIPDYFGLPGYAALSTQQVTPQQLIALFRDAPLAFAPGTQWQYSDSGYVLLGAVVERLSGLPWGEFLRQNIFVPLGMSATGYDPGTAAAGAAAGLSAWGQLAAPVDASVLYAAGGLTSTAPDLLRWHRALATGTPRLVAPATLASMFQAYAGATNPGARQTTQGYGYGWFIDALDGQPRRWHPGEINGFGAYAAMHPQADVSVILLSNLESSDVRSAGENLAGLVL